MKLWMAALALLLAGCQQSPTAEAPPPPPKPLVVATFYPLYEFARQVGGDRVDVVALVPAGVEPHDSEPSPPDMVRAQKARVFVFNGAGLEPWADRLLAEALPRDVVAVKTTEGLPLLTVDLPRHGHDHGHGKPGHGHTHEPRPAADKGGTAATDPHVWLDPVLAQGQVERIRTGLAQADPDGAEVYAENARRYTATLAALHEDFEKGLAECARRDIVVSHAAFGYLARRYRLQQVPVMGLAPEAEPSPAEMAAIVRFARRHRVKHIFFETLVSSRLAETLAREIGARTLVLDPVEGLSPEDLAAGRDYAAIMRANLENLRTALECR
jgi:zinc transport system substrate-binding protein